MDALTTPPEVPPHQPGETSSRRIFLGPVVGLALGWILLINAAVLDAQAREAAPWSDLLFSPTSPAPWEDTIPTRVRRVPVDNFPVQSEVAYRMRDVLPREMYRTLGLSNTEWLLSPQMPVEQLEPLLASGRMPVPGRPEVLAGALCRANAIQVEDARYQVVGRMKRNAGGLGNVYLLPGHYVWDGLLMHTATWGWIDPEGKRKLRESDDPQAILDAQEIHGRLTPASVESFLLSLTGLFVVAVSGARLHWHVFRRLAGRSSGVFTHIFATWTTYPRLSRGLHVSLYTGLFLAMFAALVFPVPNIILQEYLQHTFTEGDLGYVGAAYASGNIFFATAATWLNNYLVQTVAFTVLLSIVVPLAGVLKTFASFLVAGFGVSPLWSGMPGTLVFHSVTMVLELEAYIFACLAVCIFWIQVVGSIRGKHRLSDAFKTLLLGTLVSGIMLGIAALYEAATLILLA